VRPQTGEDAGDGLENLGLAHVGVGTELLVAAGHVERGRRQSSHREQAAREDLVVDLVGLVVEGPIRDHAAVLVESGIEAGVEAGGLGVRAALVLDGALLAERVGSVEQLEPHRALGTGAIGHLLEKVVAAEAGSGVSAVGAGGAGGIAQSRNHCPSSNREVACLTHHRDRDTGAVAVLHFESDAEPLVDSSGIAE